MYRIVLLGVFLASLVSCVPHKKIIYFQDSGIRGDTIHREKFNYRVQARDRLIVRVSSYDTRLTEFFNLTPSGAGGAQMARMAYSPLFNYLVTDSGYIDIPMFGEVEVVGLTLEEAREKVQELMRVQVPDAYVALRLGNFRVTVLGEVGTGKVIETENDFLTIYEALAQAGDIGEFGKRNMVRLIRNAGDSSQIFTLDLTGKEVLSSNLYYLQPNDIVYVERMPVKTFMTNLNTVTKILGIATFIFLAERLVNTFAY